MRKGRGVKHSEMLFVLMAIIVCVGTHAFTYPNLKRVNDVIRYAREMTDSRYKTYLEAKQEFEKNKADRDLMISTGKSVKSFDYERYLDYKRYLEVKRDLEQSSVMSDEYSDESLRSPMGVAFNRYLRSDEDFKVSEITQQRREFIYKLFVLDGVVIGVSIVLAVLFKKMREQVIQAEPKAKGDI